MCDVDSDEDGGLLSKPDEIVATKLVVDPTELGVDLESDVRQILVLLALAFLRNRHCEHMLNFTTHGRLMPR